MTVTTIDLDDQLLMETLCPSRIPITRICRYAAAAVLGLSLTLTTVSSSAWGAEKSATEPQSLVVEPPQGARSSVQVEGFRSAHWGMTKREVEAAIHRDFGIPPGKMHVETNPAERTTVLTVNIENLLNEAGKARVSYILGYTTKKLIEVNILWGTPVDSHVKPEQILAGAAQLRTLFLTSGYQPSSIISNVLTRSGATIVFEGRDAEKHMTVLRLLNKREASPSRGHRNIKSFRRVVVLLLSYIESTANPDIYRLKKGQF